VYRFLTFPLIALVVGCAGSSTSHRPALTATAVVAASSSAAVVTHAPPPPSEYVIGCPDVLTIQFADRPDSDCLVSVDLDGRIELDSGRTNLSGLTLAEARNALAKTAKLDPERVRIALADPRCGRLFLRGPERNRQRAISYRGPERITEFLRRAGAIQPESSDWRDVCVVRPNVATGEQTLVLRTDLEAILIEGDHSTDVILQPGDQIYVGETRQSSFARLLPTWMKPWYRRTTSLGLNGWPWER
jgi:polysaccharide biosynthesis/export protein